MHRNQKFVYAQRVWNIGPRDTHLFVDDLFGWDIEESGWCRGETQHYVDSMGKTKTLWKGIGEAMVDIHLSKVEGIYDAENKAVVVDTLSCPEELLGCEDETGTYVWHYVRYDCSTRFMSVYGPGAAIKYVPPREDEPTIVVVNEERTQQALAVILKQPKHMCGTSMYVTSDPSIFITISDTEMSAMGVHDMIPRKVDMSYRLKASFQYRIVISGLTQTQVFDRVVSQLCQNAKKSVSLARRWLENANEQSVEIEGAEEGVKFIRQGASALAIRCKRVMVALRHDQSWCSQDIPALYQNRSVFVDGLRFLIKDNSSETMCGPKTMVKWKIPRDSNCWYCSDPAIRGCPAAEEPEVLHPTMKSVGNFTIDLKYRTFGREAYDNKTLEERRRLERFYNKRQAIRNNYGTINNPESKQIFPLFDYLPEVVVDDISDLISGNLLGVIRRLVGNPLIYCSDLSAASWALAIAGTPLFVIAKWLKRPRNDTLLSKVKMVIKLIAYIFVPLYRVFTFFPQYAYKGPAMFCCCKGPCLGRYSTERRRRRRSRRREQPRQQPGNRRIGECFQGLCDFLDGVSDSENDENSQANHYIRGNPHENPDPEGHNDGQSGSGLAMQHLSSHSTHHNVYDEIHDGHGGTRDSVNPTAPAKSSYTQLSHNRPLPHLPSDCEADDEEEGDEEVSTRNRSQPAVEPPTDESHAKVRFETSANGNVKASLVMKNLQVTAYYLTEDAAGDSETEIVEGVEEITFPIEDCLRRMESGISQNISGARTNTGAADGNGPFQLRAARRKKMKPETERRLLESMNSRGGRYEILQDGEWRCHFCRRNFPVLMKRDVEQHHATKLHADAVIANTNRTNYMDDPDNEVNIGQELTEAFVSSDIPLFKINSPHLRTFLESFSGLPIPSERTLRRYGIFHIKNYGK